MAGAIRGETVEHSQAISDYRLLEDLIRSGSRVKIGRLDTVLTTWDVVDRQPGRIRFRHESIRLDRVLAGQVQHIVAETAGVFGCSVQPLTGSVLIRFDPAVTSASRLLHILERERPKTNSFKDLRADVHRWRCRRAIRHWYWRPPANLLYQRCCLSVPSCWWVRIWVHRSTTGNCRPRREQQRLRQRVAWQCGDGLSPRPR